MFVATKKINDNFSMPEPLNQIWGSWTGPKGSKGKWMYGGAAILALARLSPEERQELVKAVGAADIDDSFQSLLDAANLQSKAAQAARQNGVDGEHTQVFTD